MRLSKANNWIIDVNVNDQPPIVHRVKIKDCCPFQMGLTCSPKTESQDDIVSAEVPMAGKKRRTMNASAVSDA